MNKMPQSIQRIALLGARKIPHLKFVARHPTLTTILATLALLAAISFRAYSDPLPAGFVRLADVDRTIRQDIRYAGLENFLHRKANGYEAPVCILTEQAAKALASVQRALSAKGLTLIVFDCYRPARAVADFGAWVREGGPPDARWYPRTRRGDLIAEQYIASHSSHSRGSTVDLALAPADASKPAAPDPDCGAEKTGTVAFGTGFECLDPKSRTARVHRSLTSVRTVAESGELDGESASRRRLPSWAAACNTGAGLAPEGARDVRRSRGRGR